MPAREICSRCAAVIPANAPQGLCSACLLRTGLAALTSSREWSRLSAQPEKNKARSTVGDYELLEEIARGGMGIVFRARQISLNRIVAVKALLFGEFASDPFIARFRAEAQAAAALQHPNIVAVHDVWEHSGQHFFSMEFVEGQTLAQIVKEGPLTTSRAAHFAEIIARAVHCAHSCGILHRDLKPSNILIDLADRPRITDFGLAKRLDQESPQSMSGLIGSPHYMSPEQAGRREERLGPGADIYSIGAMVYHMVTGRPPFVGASIEEILTQAGHAEPISPRLLNASVPRDLETICLKCLEKDPVRRYASALELADDLDRFLKRIPIRARSIAPAERMVRWCRRNPAPTGLLALVTAIAMAATWASVHLRDLNQTVRIGQYVSDMNVAMRHLEEGDSGHAIVLLKAHVPKSGELDLRGFEWRHMWWLCRGNYEAWLPAHPQIVGAIHYSSDGKRGLTFAWDGTARLWDTGPRRSILVLEKISGLGGFTVDERSIVVNRENGDVQIIDAGSGATNRAFPIVGQLVGYAQKSEMVATLDKTGRLSVWSLQTGRTLLAISNAPPARLNYSWNSPVAIAPDGSKLALIVPSANPLLPARAIRVWNLITGAEMESLSENRELRCIAFSPDAKTLLTGDGQGKVRVWNLARREFRDIAAHTMPVLSLAFSPDGKAFATGSSDHHSILLWDLATAAPMENEFRGQAGDVWSLRFSPDGKRLASGTRDGIIRFWTIERAKPLPQLDRLHADEYANIAFSPDSQFFAGGCANGVVKIWTVASHETVAVIPRVNYVIGFSTDGRRLLVSNKAGDAFWWDIEKHTAERLPNYGGNLSEVISVALAPNRRVAALGLADGGIALVYMETGLPGGPILKKHTGPVYSVAFSPNGEKLASGGGDMNVMMWDVQTGANLGACQEHKAAVYGVAISPDGKTLASGCGAETIKLWDVDNVARPSRASASFHRAVIRALSFSPDNRTLASGSEDRTVKLWNFAAFSKSTSRREVASFTFNEPLRGVSFSPDGNTLAAVTDQGTVRLFHAFSLEECDRQGREIP
jgi:WD40 repeat protein